MSDIPTVSVIIPTYNRPKLLESCLLSLYEQTFKDFEVIVVDDGSNDYEANFNRMICEVYKKLDLNLTYIKLHKNSGAVSIPRNIGVAKAKGALIAPIDDDCWCAPNKFEVLTELFTNNEIVLTYGERIDCEMKNGNLQERSMSSTAYLEFNGERVSLDNGQFIFRSSVYDAFGPIFPTKNWETYRLIGKYGNFSYTPEVVCKCILHETNSSRTAVDPTKVLGEFKGYFNGTRFEDAIASIL